MKGQKFWMQSKVHKKVFRSDLELYLRVLDSFKRTLCHDQLINQVQEKQMPNESTDRANENI